LNDQLRTGRSVVGHRLIEQGDRFDGPRASQVSDWNF
jgi:hypothetical protein